MGCIYRRGKTWWIKYSRNGKPYYESSHSEKKVLAERLLKKREGEISVGRLPGVYFDRVRIEDLAEDFLVDYRINQRKSLDKAERSVRHLSRAFSGMRATEITSDRVKAYTKLRMNEGAANATINRELAALKRMFNLGARQTPPKVDLIPYIPMLKENNTRKGFFEHEDYLRVREAVPAYLRPVVTFAYYYGWRKREILDLTWEKVDLRNRVVRLEPGESKNDEARTIILIDEVLEKLVDLHRNRNLGCPYVFNYKGERIASIHKAWTKACKKVGLKGKLFHDFRRTAVRNMVRAGVPERVAMLISGHKTRAVFERYNIVSEEDLQEAATKVKAYLARQNGYNAVTIPQEKVIELNQAGD